MFTRRTRDPERCDVPFGSAWAAFLTAGLAAGLRAVAGRRAVASDASASREIPQLRKMFLSRASEVRGRETGSVVVEALLAVLLLVPLLYLAIMIGRVQAGTFAAETAAREAVRAVVTADSAGRGAARADAAVRLALRDQDLPDDAGSLALVCEHPGCLIPDGDVAAVVRVAVPLPLVPATIGAHVPVAVHVEAAHVGTVGRFRAVAP